ncbi:LuxR family transcriptional regulator [Geobacter pickeringii]|uniref:LuxR family transcriptional regulator n=1 Tax=Geobacter pickeringii TaxID=345632 RepID=A0A0B5BEA3_9BACT|nr:LuxR family transcriptional regulator [Geobacter pickeringii]
MIRILIADDHGIFREGLKQVIAGTANMTVAGEAADGLEVLGKIREHDYDLVILDISLPGRSGLEILAEVKALRPKLPILVLSMYPEEQYAMRALKSGASGYLTKGSSFQELVEALQKIAMGKKYVSAAMAEVLASRLASDTGRPPHERLSDREFQVMRMIATGATPKRIADELMVGIKTINTYRVRILQKMEMKCNADLTRYAIEHRLM